MGGNDRLLFDDEKPWVPIAEKVLEGEYDRADGSTKESIIIGLQNIPDDKCRAGAKRLIKQREETQKPKRTK